MQHYGSANINQAQAAGQYTTPQAVPTDTIGFYISRLNSALESVGDALNRHEDKLGPILRSNPPKPGEATGQGNETTEYASALLAEITRINAMAERIRELTSRAAL